MNLIWYLVKASEASEGFPPNRLVVLSEEFLPVFYRLCS